MGCISNSPRAMSMYRQPEGWDQKPIVTSIVWRNVQVDTVNFTGLRGPYSNIHSGLVTSMANRKYTMAWGQTEMNRNK